jgi:hypothetical protein
MTDTKVKNQDSQEIESQQKYKTEYQTYIQEYVTKRAFDKEFLKTLANNIDTSKEKKKEGQLILRKPKEIVVWTKDIINTSNSETSKPTLIFDEPEKLPKTNLIKDFLIFDEPETKVKETDKSTTDVFSFETEDTKNKKVYEFDNVLDSELEEELPDFFKVKKADKNQSLYNFFDQQKKNISVNQDKLNKIKKKLNSETIFEKKEEKTGFFKSILDTFGSDFFWQSIAFTMLLAVLLFFFGGLQPAFVKAYAKQAIDKITTLNNTFREQTLNFNQMQGLVLNRFNYDSNLLCSQTPTYTFLADDLNRLTSLRNNLTPDINLSELEKIGPFFDSEILAKYKEGYQAYTNLSNQSLQKSTELDFYLKFLNYRNDWITACQELQNSSFNQANRQQACQDLSTATEIFEEEKMLENVPNLKSQIREGLKICTDINNKDFENQWFIKYDLVMGYSPNFEDLNKNVLNWVENLNSDLEEIKAEIKETERQKTSFPGYFHILNF